MRYLREIRISLRRLEAVAWEDGPPEIQANPIFFGADMIQDAIPAAVVLACIAGLILYYWRGWAE
jgi:hypothetical protein